MNVVNLNEHFNSFIKTLSIAKVTLRHNISELDSFDRSQLLEQSINESLQIQRRFAAWMMGNNNDVEATDFFVMTMWQLSDRLLNLCKSKEVETVSLFNTNKSRDSEVGALVEYFLFLYTIIQLSPTTVKAAHLFNTNSIKYLTMIHSVASAKV